MINISMIYRAPLFSPNSAKKDKAILDAVGSLLKEWGANIEYIQEEDLIPENLADVYLSMARLPETLEILKRHEDEGRRVINSVRSVYTTIRRSYLDRLMREDGFPVAPLCQRDKLQEGVGFWLKRGDSAAQCLYDVQYAEKWEDVVRKLEFFDERGITDVLITRHVPGDVVKFYGVRGTDFFRCYYPTDDGQKKYDDECHNGRASHFLYNETQFHSDADKIAAMAGLDVYGGDCIVQDNGTYVFIDINDWPSFARCREEAAQAIASLIIR